MFINSYFPTVIWSEEKPEFVTSLNKASNKYITDARKREKAYIKEHGDFGRSYHSTPLTADNDFLDFRNYIGQKSWEYLDHQGYDMQQYTTMFSEIWVQEFAKKGGGHHSAHIHWNQHISGFYFIKKILEKAPLYLNKNGILIMETGIRLSKKVKENYNNLKIKWYRFNGKDCILKYVHK